MKRSLTSLALVFSMATPTLAQEIGTIDLRDLTNDIVPTSARPGADRDFDGNGPIMSLGTELTIGRGGRAVFVSVIFSAREDGGDGTATSIRTRPMEVWRWKPEDGPRFVSRIITDPIATTRLRAVPGCGPIGCGTIGPAEDGGLILTQSDLPGYLNAVTYLSDTLGDDISTDQNPHGDTSIRNISFDAITVEFSDRLGG
ncbi:MAG: hypothetical protein AAFW87_05540 [Pseudomonadota bacterium]